jgi:hypothetical protein
MFILSERDEDPAGSFHRYRDYLRENESRFPPGAYALASSDWYFDFRRHECPHDAWLQWAKVEEPAAGERHENRTVALSVSLLGAYHDGIIELRYPRVFEYRFNSAALEGGHRDWRYDEFRVNAEGQLIHEIEWGGHRDTGSWLVVASDIEYKWSPFQ